MVSDAADGGDASASDAPVGSDAIVKPDASPPPPLLDGGPACNDVNLLGADVTIQGVAQDAPPMASGAQIPAPGTYALDSATFYTGKGGQSGALGKTNTTLRIESDGITYQVATSQDGQPARRTTYQLGKSANGYTLTGTCGLSDVSQVAFVPINSPGFVIVAGSGNTTAVEIFRPFIK